MSDTPTAASYRIGWERYWNSIETRPVEVFWNAEAEEATRDVALFADTLDPNLPLVDIGCGDGVHTRALAALTRLPAVIGVDVAPSAIRRAQAAASDQRLSFRVLDLLHPEQAEALHEEIGDANLHVRGVLHQFPPAGRKIAIESLAKLLGTNGLLYLKELTPRSEAYLANMLNEFGPPSSLGRVMDELFPFHIKWGGLSDLDLKELFPDDSFILLRKGETSVRTTNHLPSGKAIEIPAAYALLRVGLTVSNPTSSYREG